MFRLRGDFKKHPISRENFLKFIRTYRTKPGLENAGEITALVISVYGSDYRKAIDLLDPADRENNPAEEVLVRLPGTSDVVTTINNLLEFSAPEATETAFKTLTSYHWFVRSGSGLEAASLTMSGVEQGFIIGSQYCDIYHSQIPLSRLYLINKPRRSGIPQGFDKDYAIEARSG